MKNFRKESAMSVGATRVTPFYFLTAGAVGILLFAWPIMALIKGHTGLCYVGG
jgi:hypothetical protein